jgi:3-oxoadipate enol-lactonase
LSDRVAIGKEVLMPKISINGADLFYETHGEGTPLVQLHNAALGRLTFARVTPFLARHYKVVDYDMRGFGKSDAPVQPYSIEVWADDAAALIEALGFERVNVHGQAMGTLTGINLAARYPHLVDKLILTSPLAKYDTWDQLRRRVLSHLVRAYGTGEEVVDFNMFLSLSHAYLDEHYEEGRAYIGELPAQLGPPEVEREIHKAMVNADQIAMLPRVRSKTLIIAGRDDIAHGSLHSEGPKGAHSLTISQRIPNAELKVLEGAAVLLECPERVSETIVEFLGGNEAASR